MPTAIWDRGKQLAARGGRADEDFFVERHGPEFPVSERIPVFFFSPCPFSSLGMARVIRVRLLQLWLLIGSRRGTSLHGREYAGGQRMPDF
jgi:hypothetical protein